MAQVGELLAPVVTLERSRECGCPEVVERCAHFDEHVLVLHGPFVCRKDEGDWATTVHDILYPCWLIRTDTFGCPTCRVELGDKESAFDHYAEHLRTNINDVLYEKQDAEL